MPTLTSPNRELLRLLHRPVLFVWAWYILLSPFDVGKVGLPQPGDALIIVLVPLAFAGWNGRLHRGVLRVIRPIVVFTLWVLFVNLVWALVLSTWGMNLLFPLYYIYNLSFFLAALVLFQRFGDPFIRLTVYLVWVTVVFQVGASLVMVGGHSRAQLFFSNPNQLGYYALLSGCIIALTQSRLGIGRARSSVGLVFCAYLALLSGSRSAAAGIGLLLMLLLLSDPRTILIGSLASVGFTFVDNPIDQSVETLQNRINDTRNTSRTFFEDRGYDRIWNNPHHLLFGAGEGNTKRFRNSTSIGGSEIHSSFGTIIFGYGILGLTLFGTFLVRVLRAVSLRVGLVLLPPLVYSFAHQGLRFTMLWVLFAMFVAFKARPVARAVRGAVASSPPAQVST